ncbi:hypothetical protein N7478_005761 [Penicillium angulare]|uniref:uncharacterized protein n=1 Tax=Penicillium angulare TaxID=116970 RepID=UPI002541EB99|nr:uncharacterized protein N7478_005761 [Penicillium angulare]KAJ5280389.1 hypothetical protein N7478_005761 [Penicillium angulare]
MILYLSSEDAADAAWAAQFDYEDLTGHVAVSTPKIEVIRSRADEELRQETLLRETSLQQARVVKEHPSTYSRPTTA